MNDFFLNDALMVCRIDNDPALLSIIIYMTCSDPILIVIPIVIVIVLILTSNTNKL